VSPILTANRRLIDSRPNAFGKLEDSSDQLGHATELRRRLNADGYLYLSHFVDQNVLGRIRKLVVEELRRKELLGESSDDTTLPARPGVDFYGVLQELGSHDTVRQITRLDSLVTLFSDLLGEPARGLDFVWPRAAGPGRGEVPHCDWVYVSRGTPRLLTVWIPLTDVPLARGPIMVLEKSHRANALTKRYLDLDADKLGFLGGLRMKHGHFITGGRYSRRPDKVQQEFGTRWLTENFSAGDLLIFGPKLVHATLDNQTNEFRFSIDTRFQPVSEPMDPRFAGPRPEAHSRQDKSIFDYYTQLKRRLTGRDVARPTRIALAYSQLQSLLERKKRV
jgi:hypothetical protein